MPLQNFGSILNFAEELEQLDQRFYEAAWTNPTCGAYAQLFADLAVEAFSQARSLEDARQGLVSAVENHARELEEAIQREGPQTIAAFIFEPVVGAAGGCVPAPRRQRCAGTHPPACWRLVLNDWYLVDDYHRDHGEGGDFYSAGRSRGCGGSGLMIDGALAVSKNFRSTRVLASGPLRVVFEASYPEWEKPGLGVTEVKRVTLDAGSHFNRFESFYLPDGDVTWAAGIRKAKDVVPRVDRERGVVRTWEHLTSYGDDGWLGCGLVIDPGTVVDVVEQGGNQLVVARAPKGRPATWYAGSGWDRSGYFPDVLASRFAAHLDSHPLRRQIIARLPAAHEHVDPFQLAVPGGGWRTGQGGDRDG